MKFDGLFIGRLHYQDKIQRETTKTMELLWKASESLGKDLLFTLLLARKTEATEQ